MDQKDNQENLLARWMIEELSDADKSSIDSDDEELKDLRIVIDSVSDWSLPPVKQKTFLEAKNSTLSKSRSLFSNSWMLIAASVALFIVVGYLGWWFFQEQEVYYQTQIGETMLVPLPDGSTVNLDALSELSFSKNSFEEKRDIHLKGQAYFEVVKGKSFTVISQQGNVQVLGTRFNVLSMQDRFKVECYEGSVQVKANQEEVILEKGENAALMGNDLVKGTIPFTAPSWTQGYLQYTAVDLKTICSDLTRYFNVEIPLPDKYKSLKYTGKLPTSSLPEALERLFIPMEIAYELVDDKKVVF